MTHRAVLPARTDGFVPLRRRMWRGSIAGLAVLATVVATPEMAGAAEPLRFTYNAYAFGTSVSVGSTLTSGPTAAVTLSCIDEAGVHKSNTVVDVKAPPVAFSGTVRTTSDTSADPTQSRTTAETEKVSLLDGLVTADLVKAVSATTHDSGGFRISGEGSSFLNLRVGVAAVSATPGPNTRVDLPDLGHVVLNEQVGFVSASKAAITVRMIHVFVTVENLLGIPVGTEIIVSHAKSGLEGPVDMILDGRAYGTSAAIGTSIGSGPSAVVYMPCLGTGGNLRTNSLATVNVPGVLTSGTLRNTAKGTVTASSATGETTSTVEKVSLLDGLVKADLVKADAHASFDGTTSSFSDAGSTLLNLSVMGHPTITANAGPNTKVKLAGLGTLYIHRIIRTATSIEVRMIELVVELPNDYGLALGSRLRVAVASASVH